VDSRNDELIGGCGPFNIDQINRSAEGEIFMLAQEFSGGSSLPPLSPPE